MKHFTWSLVLAFIAFACQMQDEPTSLREDAASSGPYYTDANSYINTYSFNPDGTTLTLTIGAADSRAKDISHLIFKFTGCDGTALKVGDITAATANGVDVFSSLGSTEGQGTDCYDITQIWGDPFIKLNTASTGYPFTVVLSFSKSVAGGAFLLKTASVNAQTGGGCFGLNDPKYAFSRDCTPPAPCYQDDTAWATGQRYISRGNWATFTAYAEGTSVNLYAGQSKFAGSVAMLAASGGNVTLSITLNEGWSLQQVANPIKVQGYEFAPSGNPSPGRFTNKGSSFTVTVPLANFYGIHLDVRQVVPCP